jgi:rsbT co-antagonist protein RsbR
VASQETSKIPELLRKEEREILADWLELQRSSVTLRSDLMKESELQIQSREFLALLREATQKGNLDEIHDASWDGVRDFLDTVSRSRAQQGFTPSETAMFVFSLKQPLFTRLRQEYGRDGERLAEELWKVTTLVDQLGLHTTEVFQKSREEIIGRQQEELLELSTPVVELWRGVLALPLIGTLDSARTQVVMESLLQRIVQTGSAVAIIDITGVPTVDTLVAQHLLKTVAAARLMGADCIISGIRPQIAQTIVHLGIDLANIITKASLADAFAIALQRSNLTIKKKGEVKEQKQDNGVTSEEGA